MVYFLSYESPWAKYPSMKFIDGDPSKVELIDPTGGPQFNLLTATRPLPTVGRAIKPDHVPTTLQWTTAKAMPDFEGPPGFRCVSPRFKDIIEQLDPRVHQFFPLMVVNKAREPIAEHWLWVVCNLIDSVDRKHSNMRLLYGRHWTADGVTNPKLVFSLSQIGDRHFWIDPYLSGPNNFLCSDAAGAKIKQEKLTAISLKFRETI